MALLLLLLTCTSAHTPSPAQPHRKAGTCKIDLPLQAVFAESCVSRRVEGRNICDTTTRTSEPFRVTSEALQCLRNTKTIFTLWIVQLSVVTSSPYLVNNIFLLEKKKSFPVKCLQPTAFNQNLLGNFLSHFFFSSENPSNSEKRRTFPHERLHLKKNPAFSF